MIIPNYTLIEISLENFLTFLLQTWFLCISNFLLKNSVFTCSFPFSISEIIIRILHWNIWIHRQTTFFCHEFKLTFEIYLEFIHIVYILCNFTNKWQVLETIQISIAVKRIHIMLLLRTSISSKYKRMNDVLKLFYVKLDPCPKIELLSFVLFFNWFKFQLHSI